MTAADELAAQRLSADPPGRGDGPARAWDTATDCAQSQTGNFEPLAPLQIL